MLLLTTAVLVFVASIECGYSISSPEVVQEYEQQLLIRRFIHGCPFAFPCPLPPCDNPVFGPHDCCGSCPDPQPEVSKTTTSQNSPVSGKVFRRHAKQSSVLRKHVFDKYAERNIVARDMKMTTTPPTTTSECPYPCTYGGRHYCHPFPCHITCVDAIRPPGTCCEVCPNGPNCHYNGHIIPEGKNATFGNGLVVYCANGDLYGGNLHIYRPTVG